MAEAVRGQEGAGSLPSSYQFTKNGAVQKLCYTIHSFQSKIILWTVFYIAALVVNSVRPCMAISQAQYTENVITCLAYLVLPSYCGYTGTSLPVGQFASYRSILNHRKATVTLRTAIRQ